MSLRANTYVALTGAAFFAVVLIFAATIYAGRAWIHAAERQNATLTMMQVKRTIDADAKGLDLVAADWAMWDDAFRYVQGPNADFEAANLNAEILDQLDVDAILILNANGDIVAERVSSQLISHPEAHASLLRQLAPEGRLSPLVARREGAHGILGAGDSAMLVAARPITRSTGEPPAVGTFVLARLLDARRLASIGQISSVQLAPHVPDDPRIPSAVRSALPGLPGSEPVYIDVVRPLDLTAFMRLDDMTGKPALVLSSKREPVGYFMAIRTLASLIGVFLLGGMIWVTIAFSAVDRASLSRISWLRQAMSGIGRSGELRSRIEIDETESPDEAAVVATEVNHMLDALASSHEQILESEERHRVLVQSMADAVLTIGPEGRFNFCNPQAETLLGRPREELLGTPYSAVLAHESRALVDHTLETISAGAKGQMLDVSFLDATGRALPVELAVSPVRDLEGRPAAIHWVARDVTERRRFQDQLMRMANHDHLTGLFNRRRFEEEIAQHLAETRRRGDGGALLWLDVDNFKEVNDSFGHRVGDEVLTRVAAALSERSREEHVLARLGGDEFAMLLPGSDEAEARSAADRILRDLGGTTLASRAANLRLTASIGIALFPQHATTVEELLLRADLAMYRAKEGGRNRACVFSPDSDWPRQLVHRREWAQRIEEALATDCLIAYVQPILDVRRAVVSGYELLVRMRDADGSIVLPGDFLGAAEDIGLIGEIDRWMVRRATELVSASDSLCTETTLFCNVSAKTLADRQFSSYVQEQLEARGVRPGRIGFELTETAIVTNMARAHDFVENLRGLGCKFALDDFGSGFASFTYLRHMPVDVLKIDGSLVRDIDRNRQDEHMVRAIVELARCLGISVTAEFIEREETLELLREIGVEYAQGFHIGPPLPAEQVFGMPDDQIRGEIAL